MGRRALRGNGEVADMALTGADRSNRAEMVVN
jgi:hypothetical protein